MQQERVFVPGSPLKSYLHKKFPEYSLINREVFYLNEVITFLKHIMGKERLYDIRNRSVIVCDEALGQALDLGAVHLSQVRECVRRQLVPRAESPLDAEYLPFVPQEFGSHEQKEAHNLYFSMYPSVTLYDPEE